VQKLDVESISSKITVLSSHACVCLCFPKKRCTYTTKVDKFSIAKRCLFIYYKCLCPPSVVDVSLVYLPVLEKFPVMVCSRHVRVWAFPGVPLLDGNS
jgi:hypothetical protein